MSELTLSARDLVIVQKVFQCFKSPDALKIDTEKLAQLAGFSNGRSANASWCVIKKKLMGGNDEPAAANEEKAAAANAETPTKATPKKGGRAAKAKTPGEGEADDETTPSPKKKGASHKPKDVPATEVTSADANTGNYATAPQHAAATPTKKRRGPNKPKDPNAPPAKRAKKNAKSDAPVAAAAPPDGAIDEDSAAANDRNAEFPLTSFFGDGNARVKIEDQQADDVPLDEEEQKMVKEGLEAGIAAGAVIAA